MCGGLDLECLEIPNLDRRVLIGGNEKRRANVAFFVPFALFP